MFSIVPSYKEQFLRVCQSRLSGMCTLHKNNNSLSYVISITAINHFLNYCSYVYLLNKFII